MESGVGKFVFEMQVIEMSTYCSIVMKTLSMKVSSMNPPLAANWFLPKIGKARRDRGCMTY